MSKFGKVDIKGLKKLQQELNKLQDPDAFLEACAKELAARLLRLVVKRTPVGDYSREIQVVAKRDSRARKKGDAYTKRINPSRKQGGTLRRGWTNGEQAATYAAYVPIHHFGDTYVVEIVNPVEYASYVEYGHRTANHKKWVKGQFMMTISEQELEKIAPRILEKKIKQYFKEFMK